MSDGLRVPAIGAPMRDDRVRQALRRILDVAVIVGVTPAVAIFSAMAVREGRASPALVLLGALQLVALGVSIGGLRGRLPDRGRFYTVFLLVQTLVAVSQFGLLLGMGIMLMASVICATVFFDRRRDLVALVGAAIVGIAVLGAYAIVTRPHHLATVDLLSWPLLFRTVVTAAVGAIALGTLLSFLLRSLEGAYDRATAALASEREAQRERERLQRELELARRLEDIGRLAGGVAHDVNNALAVVLSNTELLTDRVRRDVAARELVGEIREASLGARDVVSDLMLLGQRTSSSQGECAPAIVVREMARTLRRLLPERIDLRVESDTIGQVPLDRGQLQRIVMNLVLNARDAVEATGAIAIHVREARGEITLAVRDDGVGMSAEVVDRMFDPFFTTKGLHHGTGLGLSVVQGLVLAVGGRVEVESRPGEGTTISVVLPARPARSLRPSDSEEPAPSSAPATILLVEDDVGVRRSTARLLRAEGHRVIEAENEAAAVAKLEADRYDLLITDVVMPDSNAARLIDTFLARFPGRPVIVCSGWVEEELVRHGIRAGAYGLLHKPFEREELIQAVRRAESSYPRDRREAS